MPDTITITDDRTGRSVTVPIDRGTFPSSALRELDPSLFLYDPAFMSTASCASAVTLVDGDNGILRYRGYPIDQLAESSTYLEVAYLLIHGELPSQEEYDVWVHDITVHTYVHEKIKQFINGFHYDAHPMGVLVGTVGALSTFYPEAKEIFDGDCRM
ncbi:MAG: gltA, partial [Acidimicrobiales bacterium]|nr:gltA [Acidimicrobiales bacterium]